MGCGSCGTSNGLPKGCNNNGACGTDGCGKLSVFDWLSNMQLPNGQKKFNFVEVRFKNDRKFYYKNENNISLNIGDVVAVEGNPGHDIGVVTLTGELVRIQMKKKNLSWISEDVKKVYRKANQKDIETWQEFRNREKQTMVDSRIMSKNLNLEMKICDVEYQGDGSKVTFYYTAEGRVDFRQLIKDYASRFGVRIEMKQIGYRQEAAKVGGIGSCGRELCCSTWLTDFRSVSTAAARYQQLSINSQKLAGQCGKLKCCLNFELDSYLDALNSFPSMESRFETEKGWAHCIKVDVFKREMWFAYEKGGIVWYKFSVEDIEEFLKLNERKKKIEALEDLVKNVENTKPDFGDVIEENSLERFERKEKQNNRRRKPRNGSKENSREKTKKAETIEKNEDEIELNKTNNSRKPSKANLNKQQPNAKQSEEQNRDAVNQVNKKGRTKNKNQQNRNPQHEENKNKPDQKFKNRSKQKDQNTDSKKEGSPKNKNTENQSNQIKSTNRNKKRFNRGSKPDNTQS